MTPETYWADLIDRLSPSQNVEWRSTLKEIISRAVAEEREACAKIAEEMEIANSGYDDIAVAIRARGQESVAKV